MPMRRDFGSTPRGETEYHVYESDREVRDNALPHQISYNNLGSLFDGQHHGHHATNICTSGNYRLDKQNENLNGPVNFPGINGVSFDNLSVQRDGASIAVLFIQTGFMETFTNPNNGNCGAGMNDLRGMFGHYRNNNTEDGEKLLLRILYTWLCASNRVNRKIVICTQNLPIANPVNPALVNVNVDQIKQNARNRI